MAHHTRSISLPTTSNPLTLTVEEQLCRLRSSDLATSSSSSISHNLVALKELYESVDDLIQLKPIQYENSLDTVLDRSLMLLDVCSTTKDVLSQMQQCVQDLQSSIHRRGDFDLANEYMTSRKKIVKIIRKCLGDLKMMRNKNIVMDIVLREVEETSFAVFESILTFLSGSKQRSKSLISKLMNNKRVTSNEEINEVEKVNMALNARDIKSSKKSLETLEINIQDFGEGLESVFRSLIKTRVSLLNILN